MDQTIYDILKQLPRNTTIDDIEDWYIVIALERNNQNRTKTCAELKISLRKLRMKINLLFDLGYPIIKMPTNEKHQKKKPPYRKAYIKRYRVKS